MRNILTIALTAILAAAIAFYGGVKYSQGTGASGDAASAAGGFRGSMPASGTAGVRAGMGGGVGGEVIASDGKSVTIKTADGSTRVVYLASSTRVTSSSEATLTDLATGATVVVAGGSSTEESGAITARSIQIVPAGADAAAFGGMRGGAPSGTPDAPVQ